MSNSTARRQKRNDKALTLMKLQDAVHHLDEYNETLLDQLIKHEKEINEFKTALILHNKVLDILIKKDIISHDDITEALQSDDRLTVKEEHTVQT